MSVKSNSGTVSVCQGTLTIDRENQVGLLVRSKDILGEREMEEENEKKEEKR